MAYIRYLAAALCCGFFLSTALAAQQPNATSVAPEASIKPRPKIALVLSGGGARGFAHIGVLRALQELRIPVDIVVGTSMGSVVGGAYAAGSSVDQLEQLVRRTDWNAVVADRPPRDELFYRRREEDLLLPSRIEFGAHLDGVSLPPAAAGNEALELALTRVLPPGARDKPANLLQLPFRSVASDLVTGELVELTDTPLFKLTRPLWPFTVSSATAPTLPVTPAAALAWASRPRWPRTVTPLPLSSARLIAKALWAFVGAVTCAFTETLPAVTPRPALTARWS